MRATHTEQRMSLKTVHLLLISFFVLTLVFFGCWGVLQYQNTTASQFLFSSAISFVLAIFFGIYGMKFLQKIRSLNL